MSFPPFQAIPKLVDLSEIPLDVSLILHPCTFAKIYNVRYSDRRMRAAWKSFVTFTSSSFCIMPEMMRWHPVCAQLPLDDSIFDSNRQTLHNGDKIGGVLFFICCRTGKVLLRGVFGVQCSSYYRQLDESWRIVDPISWIWSVIKYSFCACALMILKRAQRLLY
ncbi:hypothetical protein JG687_00012366 [Phytophthora cactorum]|uniref:Uncharacterized protein n=1 Tax=Phytophthora cactorum TaxID=29920 RepID=A0A8T1U244_9STRA|nr:hypothetical protein JG687_00012366 [Phytophthora cactorum]